MTKDFIGLMLIIGFFLGMFILARYEDYQDAKLKKRYKNLTGNHRIYKTPKGIVIELEHMTPKKKVFKKAKPEELKFLKLTKYLGE